MCDWGQSFAGAIRASRAFEESLNAAGRVALAIADLANSNDLTVEEAAAIMRSAQARYGLTDERAADIAEVLVGARKATLIDPSKMNDA